MATATAAIACSWEPQPPSRDRETDTSAYDRAPSTEHEPTHSGALWPGEAGFSVDIARIRDSHPEPNPKGGPDECADLRAVLGIATAYPKPIDVG